MCIRDRLLNQESLKHMISKTYSIDDIIDAHNAMESGSIIGNIVIEIWNRTGGVYKFDAQKTLPVLNLLLIKKNTKLEISLMGVNYGKF